MHGHAMTIERPPLNRRGKKRRKRATGDRTATGRAHRQAVDYRTLAAAQPHRRCLPEADRLSEKAGTVIGCLNLLGRISDDQYEAGKRYSVIVGAYRAMIGVPQGLSGGGKAGNCWGIAPCPSETCVCLARKNRYDDAYCAIRTHAAHLAVNAVAIHDHDISPDQLIHLRAGLSALARHFGLTGKGKSS